MRRAAILGLALALAGGCGGASDAGTGDGDGSAPDGARGEAGVVDGGTTDGSLDGQVSMDGAAPSDGSASLDGSASFDGGDAMPADGAFADGAFADGALADGAFADGALADGAFADGALDAGPPPGRTTSGPVDATGGLDVTTVVVGGAMPLSCRFYEGPGEGRVPSGVSLGGDLGCTVGGSPDATEPPGVYGFIVVVEDALGRTVEIPTYVEGDPCDTTAVTIDPTAPPIRTQAPGSAYSWTLDVGDIDAPCGSDCTSCGWCLNMNLDASVSVAADLDCSATGVLCSDCMGCATAIEMCPDVIQMSRDVEVRSHPPIRSGSPAWLVTEVSLEYSGTSTSPTCGNKRWDCVLSTLETE